MSGIKHYGDITKINGAEVEPVDIICGGSPCQDLSVAGKRAGLAGERSGLFMEQIRIVKEMRENDRRNGRADNACRPRFLVWENVCGAFSSGTPKGEDFRIVLEEICRIKDKDAVVPQPPKGKWQPSGCIMGDGWSIAWRVHDAQFWGVPQRRKRIALVADFAGGAAPEILFEREGLLGNIEESGEERKNTPEDIRDCASETSGAISFQERAGCSGGGKGILIQDEKVGTLSTLNNQSVCYGISAYESNAMKSSNPHSGVYEADTARTLDLNGGSPACNQGGMAVVCLEGNGSRPSHRGDGYKEGDTMYTLNSTEHHAVAVAYRGDAITSPINASNPHPGDPCHTLTDDSRNYVVIENHPADSRVKVSDDGMVQTLSSRMGTGGGNVPMVMNNIYSIGHDERTAKFTDDEIIDPLTASDYKDPVKINDPYIVRRLTPLECERLQGFPDGWTDIGDWVDSKGKKHKGDADSPRYRALGNSIALPFWEWMAKRMVKYLDDEPTMASLFDGIGGFPLVYQRAGCEPVWASEIEEFPIAVTKLRFMEE